MAVADDMNDDDVPLLTAADFARARPASKAFSDVALKDFSRRRGRPSLPDKKVQVSIRLDPGVLTAFKATGVGWQKRVNDVLREAADKLPSGRSVV